MVKVGDRVQIYEVGIYYGSCGIVIDSQRFGEYPYKVKFEGGDWSIFTEKDLIVLSTEEETSMKFKVGDKVKILNTEFGNQGRVGTVTTISGTVMIYLVEIVGAFGKDRQWSNASDLELVEEEKEMKFKVGDKVKVKDSWFGHDGQVGVVLDTDNYEPYNYIIKFDTEGDNGRRDENFMGNSLELVTEEEEKEMKFKVGDKVKVKDSWLGFTGEVGLIVRIDGPAKYPYRVKFDVVDEEDEELFAEGSLELVKEKAEKQSFTKSDLKTGMGVVLRNGRKGHILVDTGCVDVIRFLENGNYSCLNDFSDNLTSNYMEEHDIVEVYFTEYQYKLLTDRVFDQGCVFKREPEPEPEPKPEPEPTKMTMKEINEHFGKPIEIIE